MIKKGQQQGDSNDSNLLFVQGPQKAGKAPGFIDTWKVSDHWLIGNQSFQAGDTLVQMDSNVFEDISNHLRFLENV